MSDESTSRAEDRLRRLEEAQGFLEHAHEALIDHVRSLDRRLAEVHARIDRLEARLSQAEAGEESDAGEA